jgi:P pilus assembly chaperone PapD
MKRPLFAFLLLAVVVARASAQESFAVSTDTVNIGPVLVGTTKQAVLKLYNSSNGPITVTIDASM